MSSSKNLENKTPLDTYWIVQLVCMQVQARSSLEPPLKHNQYQMLLKNQCSLRPFNYLGSYRNIMQFQIISRWETSKEMPEPWRLEFFEKFLANRVALSDAEDNTFGPLNREVIVNLPLLRALFHYITLLGSHGLLFYYDMQVCQLQESFCNGCNPVWTLL